VMTVLDGYPLARQGRAASTLAIAAISSFIAGTMGVTALAFVAVPLAALALHFGPTEDFGLIFFALSTVSALTGDSLAQGLMSTFLGLLLATVGIDPAERRAALHARPHGAAGPRQFPGRRRRPLRHRRGQPHGRRDDGGHAPHRPRQGPALVQPGGMAARL